ncbi:helix-turn-helix domain-containing protein [Paramagnetospirillum magnetotacticum]|uniref:helix-turn-helix domain-containing protein n=1 Tax=Paramagnetospirillum magnetotacticum TaxID=188 RepID=UPI000597AB0A|nr:helix-turn-helix transcriptional regulator [Paramagnetospirillum magnetotacticum]
MNTVSFGTRIRRKRTELGLGLRETAKRAGLSATFLSRVETGAEKAVPGEDAIRRLAEVLQENFDELMAAAGRVSSEVTDYVKASPGMPEFLRQAREQNVSVEKLMELLEKAKDDN